MSFIFKANNALYITTKTSLKKSYHMSKYYMTSSKRVSAKHFPFINNEWKDSVYSYNKINIVNSPFNHETADKLIKSYFNIVYTPNIIIRSKRMRDLIRKSSTRKIFASKPEIKQTSDKAIITVYTFDRENFYLKKKLFFLGRFFKNNNDFKLENNNVFTFDKNSSSFIKNIFKVKEKTENIYKKNNFKKAESIQLTNNKKTSTKVKHLNNPLITKLQLKKQYIENLDYNDPKVKKNFKAKFISLLRRKAIKYNFNVKYTDFENLLLSSFLKKNIFYNYVFFYKFLKWTLSFFKIKTKIVLKKNMKNIGHYVLYIQCKNVIHSCSINSIKMINIILLKCLILKSRKIFYFIKVKSVGLLLENYRKKHYRKFSRKFLRKEILSLKYLTSLFINNYKNFNFLPNFKSLIKNLYNKKIEFNIIKLKNLHLNSDIFSQAITVKLRKKGNNLLRILRKSIKLISLPLFNVSDLIEEKNVTLNNRCNQPRDFNLNFANWKINLKSVLDSIKYKWVTGIRVEAKGRLTKRFTASRALFKFKYKGNLKNLENSKNILSVPSIYYLRDEYKPNIQHSFVSSRKRIGVFGIKTWISNN